MVEKEEKKDKEEKKEKTKEDYIVGDVATQVEPMVINPETKKPMTDQEVQVEQLNLLRKLTNLL